MRKLVVKEIYARQFCASSASLIRGVPKKGISDILRHDPSAVWIRVNNQEGGLHYYKSLRRYESFMNMAISILRNL